MHDQQGGINHALKRSPAWLLQRGLHLHTRLEILSGSGSVIGHEDFPISGLGTVNIRFTESTIIDEFLSIG